MHTIPFERMYQTAANREAYNKAYKQILDRLNSKSLFLRPGVITSRIYTAGSVPCSPAMTSLVCTSAIIIAYSNRLLISSRREPGAKRVCVRYTNYITRRRIGRP